MRKSPLTPVPLPQGEREAPNCRSSLWRGPQSPLSPAAPLAVRQQSGKLAKASLRERAGVRGSSPRKRFPKASAIFPSRIFWSFPRPDRGPDPAGRCVSKRGERRALSIALGPAWRRGSRAASILPPPAAFTGTMPSGCTGSRLLPKRRACPSPPPTMCSTTTPPAAAFRMC